MSDISKFLNSYFQKQIIITSFINYIQTDIYIYISQFQYGGSVMYQKFPLKIVSFMIFTISIFVSINIINFPVVCQGTEYLVTIPVSDFIYISYISWQILNTDDRPKLEKKTSEILSKIAVIYDDHQPFTFKKTLFHLS